MLLFFIVLLFLLNIPKEIVGIHCVYKEEPTEWELNNFNLSKFQSEINEIPSFDYKDDNIDMCRIEIYIDYQDNTLVISFADSFQWSQLYDGETRLDFLIIFDNKQSQGNYYNVLEYACNDQDHCERLFLFNHIQWLKQVNYTRFENNLKSLLFQNSTKTEKCYNDQMNSFNCSTGVCSGKYSTKHNTYLYECYQNFNTLIEVHLTTNILIEGINYNGLDIEEQQIIRYTCQYNLCNNRYLTDLLVNIVKNDFDIKSMRNSLIQLYSSDEIFNSNYTDDDDNDDNDNIEHEIPNDDKLNEYLSLNKSNKLSNILINQLLLLFIIYLI